MNLHHSGGTGGSWAKPSLKTSSIVCGVALCVILLELAAGGLAKKANIWTLSLAPYLSGAALANASDAVVLPAPTIFAPGAISGPGNDGTPSFSPDGHTLYFYRYGATAAEAVILESDRNGAGWSKPVVAPFSGPSPDRQPALSSDGRTLVYVSLRQLPVGPGEPRA